MALGIDVRTVVYTIIKPYYDSIPDPEKAEEILDQYTEVARSSIQSIIDEAEALVTSIESTCNGVISQVPIIIAQISAMATMVDPSAKAAQMTTIKQGVSTYKDSLNRASAQLSSISNISTQLHIDIPVISTLSSAIDIAKNALNTIPV